MTDPKRTDHKTETEIREALAMRRAFGNTAALQFLWRRRVNPELSQRILSAPRDQLRY